MARPATKSVKDYQVLCMTSTSVKVPCQRCGKNIEKGQTYYYKIGDEMHTVCDDMKHEYKFKTKI